MSIPSTIRKINDNYGRNIHLIRQEYEKKGIKVVDRTEIPKLDHQDKFTAEDDTEKKNNPDERIFVALVQAEKVWQHTQLEIIRLGEGYNQLSENKKTEIISKTFKDFYKEFPVVSRYMCCIQEYKKKAFEKMLQSEKHAYAKEDITNEDVWIELRAKYLMYLWEERQTKRFDRKESNEVKKNYKKYLKDEFDDFRKLHEETKVKVAKDKTKHQSQLLREVSQRLINGEQTIEETLLERYVYAMTNRLYKQRKDKSLKQIIDQVKHIEPYKVGNGTNKKAREEHDAELKMFEAKKSNNKIPL